MRFGSRDSLADHQRRIARLAVAGVIALLFIFLYNAFLANRRASQVDTVVVASGSRVALLPKMTTPRSTKRVDRQSKLLDPRNDGWKTEELAEVTGTTLRQLVDHGIHLEWNKTRSSVVPDFRATSLRPTQLETAYHDANLTVLVKPPQALELVHHGSSGLQAAINELTEPFRNAQPQSLKTKFKVIEISKSENGIRSLVKFQSSYRSNTGVVQQDATWNCGWQVGNDGQVLLSSIRTEKYESATRRQTEPWFADCTESALSRNQSFGDQVVHGLNHWLSRIESVHTLQLYVRTGLAIGDVNGDGLDDVYLCQPGGLPNRLYVHNLDGTVTDRSEIAGVDWLDHTSGALFVDLDNDGDQDLVLGCVLGLMIMQNDSSGVFKEHTVLPTTDVDLQSISAVDYDNDGDLDLFVCVDFSEPSARRGEATIGFVYHDANDGGANALFRNELISESGKRNDELGEFTNVTDAVGLGINNRRHSLAAAWEDYDNDGDQDLYVANDYGQNCLYRNDDGRFIDIAVEAGVVDFGSGMSVSWADSNRDGRMDLYVGNMFSSAGRRITTQPEFKPSLDVPARSVYERFAKGNSLFENQGSDSFKEVSSAADVEIARWAWSSVFADLNNDGWQDLYVANGYITTDDQGDL